MKFTFYPVLKMKLIVENNIVPLKQIKSKDEKTPNMCVSVHG